MDRNLVVKFAVCGTRSYVEQFERIIENDNGRGHRQSFLAMYDDFGDSRERQPYPITGVAVVPEGHPCPMSYTIVKETIGGNEANLNSGRWMSSGLYLAVQREPRKRAIVDITLCSNKPSILKDWIRNGYQVARNTKDGSASLNPGSPAYDVAMVYRTKSGTISHESLYEPERSIRDIHVRIPGLDGDSTYPMEGATIDVNKGSVMGRMVLIGWSLLPPNGILDVPFRPEVLDSYPSDDMSSSTKRTNDRESSSSVHTMEEKTREGKEEDIQWRKRVRSSQMEYKLPPSVGHFCFPQHIRLKRAREQPLPTWYTFVLTDESAGQVFGSCLKFYEQLDDEVVIELEGLKMAYEIGKQSVRRLPTEDVLVRMIEDAKKEQSLADGSPKRGQQHIIEDDDCLEERVRMKIYEQMSGDVFVAVRPLLRQLLRQHTSMTNEEQESANTTMKCQTPVRRTISRGRHVRVLSELSKFQKLRLKTFEPRCLVLLSLTRHGNAMKKFLKQLYATSISPVDIPLEKIVSNFVLNVPIPRPGCEVVVRWRGDESDPHKDIRIRSPRPDAPPLLDLTFEPLFECLSVESVAAVLHWMLLEKKLLMLSEKPCLLSHVAELLRSLLLPIEWHCVYIPLCPDFLAKFMRAPMPFIIGLPSNAIKSSDMKRMSDDIMVVDLDSDALFVGGERWSLPEKAHAVWAPLVQSLDRLVDDANIVVGDLDPNFEFAFQHFRRRLTLDSMQVRACALDFMCELLGGYRDCLRFDAVENGSTSMDDLKDIFDVERFVSRCVTSAHRELLRALTETQNFAKFIETAIYHGDDKDFVVHFFDRCVRSRVKSADSPRSRVYSLLISPPCSPQRQKTRCSFVSGPDVTTNTLASLKTYERWPDRLDSRLAVMPSPHLGRKINVRSSVNAMMVVRTRSEHRTRVSQQPAVVIRNDYDQTHSHMYPTETERFEHTQIVMEMTAQVFGAFFLCVPHFVSQHSSDRTLAFEKALDALRSIPRRGIVVDNAIFRDMYIASQHLNENIAESALAVNAEMQSMDVEANAVTFGQYSLALTRGAANMAIRQRSPSRLRRLRGSERFVELVSEERRAKRSSLRGLKKKLIMSFSPKQDSVDVKLTPNEKTKRARRKKLFEEKVKRGIPRPKSWSAGRRSDADALHVETTATTPTPLLLRKDTSSPAVDSPTLAQQATAVATAIRPTPKSRYKTRSLGRADKVRSPLVGVGVQKRLSLSPHIVAQTALRMSMGRVDHEEESVAMVASLRKAISSPARCDTGTTTAEDTQQRNDDVDKEDKASTRKVSLPPRVVMWCRTPLDDDSDNDQEARLALLDEEILALWAKRPSADRFDTKLVSSSGESFSPTLKYKIMRSGDGDDETRGEVEYLSPDVLRTKLEEIIEMNGYGVLHILSRTSPNLYWNLLWYCTRLDLPMPVGGPVSVDADVAIQWDERSFEDRFERDLGLESQDDVRASCQDLDRRDPMWQQLIRRLVPSSSTRSSCSSLYQRILWLRYKTRENSGKDRNAYLGSVSLELLRDTQMKGFEFDAAYLHAIRQLPSSLQSCLMKGTDTRELCSLCIPIRAFMGTVL